MSKIKETETKKNKNRGRRAEGGAQSPPKGRKTEQEMRAQVQGKVLAKIGKVPHNTEQEDRNRKEKKSQECISRKKQGDSNKEARRDFVQDVYAGAMYGVSPEQGRKEEAAHEHGRKHGIRMGHAEAARDEHPWRSRAQDKLGAVGEIAEARPSLCHAGYPCLKRRLYSSLQLELKATAF